jgi:multidrug efflux pump
MPTPTNNPTVVTNSAQKNQWLAERPYILAIIIVIALFLWMFSGTMNAQNIASKHQKNTQQKRNVPIAKAKLPAETEEPEVHEVTMANQVPVITVILSGAVSERGLLMLARDLKDKIEGMQQVLEVTVGGDREDMVEILVDPLLMESYGLDQGDIYNLVERNNRLVPAGTLDTGKGRFAIKVPSVFENIQDLLDLPIKVDGERVITFADVSTVRRAYKDPTTFARLNGERSISLEVKKRSGENIIETVNQVKALVNKEKQKWPNQVIVDYIGDQSKNVKETLSDLQSNVLSAILMVIIVIIAALLSFINAFHHFSISKFSHYNSAVN